jgi:8-oxo-dGTP diphosphatase
MTTRRTVRAAGVVLIRETIDGPLVCIVRRERRQDWSLPKGKLDPGEHSSVAAVRETFEETGHQVVLGLPLTTQHYEALGRPKVVHYWRGHEVASYPWSPDGEVAEVLWTTPHEAKQMLTYPRDADLVDEALTGTNPTWPLVLLRHGQAEKRADWAKRYNSAQPPEASRPLTASGRAQAADLVAILRAYGINRIVSSDAERCLRTVAPYATAITAAITVEHELSEEGHRLDPKSAYQRMSGWAAVPEPIVVSTHRPVLPVLVEALASTLGVDALESNLPPGGFLVVHRGIVDGQMQALSVERHVATR